MRYTISVHNVIAIASLLVLSYVQFFLLYNTYELKNDHYYLAEKRTITNEYLDAIKNDKVMPGGARILDKYITENMVPLETAYKRNRTAFNQLGQRVCDSAFLDLRAANNMDSLLAAIIKRNRLDTKIRYATTIEFVEVAFEHDRYIPLYRTTEGARIGGTLESLHPNNLAQNIIVSSPTDYSYRISFSLHVDTYDRRSTILKLMMPTFLLSVLSVAGVVLLYFITFRNWLRQKKLSEMKSDFINSITHEFHTPLSAIIVANRTMQNEKILASRENLLPLTEVVQRQADRLKTLISHTLRITTMNKLSLNKEVYSVHHLLDELLLDYRLKATDSDVTLKLDKKALKDDVLLDPFWFTTIILNIFDNAVKYNQREHKEIVVTSFSDRKALHIAIEDNGIGMTKEVQKHIFEKFYRDMNGSRNGIKGLGLGLYYVKQAVDSHRWKIDIRSVEGEGSVFTVSMPF
ncbi:MAG: HAMP domain-containing histidine kinase [Bacteroidetes bacterium]|nr:HAMP domain-containing histidine kinase [Bacteroidota bacterium]